MNWPVLGEPRQLALARRAAFREIAAANTFEKFKYLVEDAFGPIGVDQLECVGERGRIAALVDMVGPEYYDETMASSIPPTACDLVRFRAGFAPCWRRDERRGDEASWNS